MTTLMIYAPALTKSRKSVGKPPLGVYGDMQSATFVFWIENTQKECACEPGLLSQVMLLCET